MSSPKIEIRDRFTGETLFELWIDEGETSRITYPCTFVGHVKELWHNKAPWEIGIARQLTGIVEAIRIS